MPTDNKSLERKGRHQPTGPLVQQAEVSLGHLDSLAQPLAEHGFTREKRDELAAKTAELQASCGTRSGGQESSYAATRRESSAADAALELIRTIATVAPIVIRDKNLGDVNLSCYRAGRRLRSTSQIILWLTEVRPFVERHDDDFKPYFRGESPTALLVSAHDALAEADRIQENERQSLPQATWKLNVAKGRVLELLEELNLVAQIAFKNDRTIAARFSKEILKRARRRRRAKPDDGPATTAGGSPAPDGSSKANEPK